MPLTLPFPRTTGAQPRAGAFPDSPQFRDGVFHNRREGTRVTPESGRASIARDFARKGNSGRPGRSIPLGTPSLPPVAATCAATWLGHATVLLEVGGHFVLADPVWSERVSPATRVGPRRHHPVPLALRDLPTLSAVLISHDHYDHLDTRTIEWLTANQSVPFVVPLGIGAHLRRWGVPEHRIVELDWGQEHLIDDLHLVCAEAQHFSGRLFTNNTTLWSSWILSAGESNIFFGGDTGYHPGFSALGEQHGPFDLTVLPIGAYDNRWRDVHMDPAEALRAHAELGGEALLPIHWATFDLAFHAWADPIEWLVRDAPADLRLATPRPGDRFTTDGEVPRSPWWR
ncbi:L-ascorbate metabolism protein UlaG (beta-lactamase superfamily) [Nocardioides daedukensis]|uniref:L-ascorbate metabolism protein UlaG (Beta-lactamase superfamily) n=1 Tax=Nocardioides daedukensis TaxID=634462 RepID=A0A7Y9UPN0_9ACTN|nr:L-ascorbate metabolism protein UlaG (beta-lactamase superfamily) [Nocardioides daedukensis]